MAGASYKKAGVDVEAGDRVAAAAKAAARATIRREVVAGVGGFGALFRLPAGYKKPLLAISTDGVGTKLRVALMAKRHDTIGIDLVAMSVNDVLTLGAEPLAFLDYYVTDRLQPAVATEVLRGIARGCKLAGCSLIGGETAEHPGCFMPGEYDLAGFVVGVVEADEVVDGRRIVPGDVILGLPSNGLHSNGFSLVRQLCFERGRLSLRVRPPEIKVPLVEELLRPTRIYVPQVRALPRGVVKGMAHITGGGITGNLPRILPAGCVATVRYGSWPVPGVFRLLQRLGSMPDGEMLRTFNMGIGFMLVVGQRDADRVLATLRRKREKAYIVGEVTRQRGRRSEAIAFV
ncbi:MAG TPA: phosphoribosylformylglycinamidine cyclo-ligase [Candidatus Acidoferrales bacterium]|nr:phosphoribosylformylglycinamidine cyclo-ligase [Candidatus Acidoferrales bacterium]